jgi:leader peptidase (prepilin peptidase)/N-methyltransferase
METSVTTGSVAPVLLLVIVGLLGAGAGILASRMARLWAVRYPAPMSSIGVHSAAVALAHGVVLAALVWRWGPIASTVPLIALAWLVLSAADIDLRVHAIPDRLTLGMLPVLVVMLAVATLIGDAGGPSPGRPIAAAVTGVILPAALLATSAAFRRLRGEAGVGLGDVKLAIAIGLVLGWRGPGLVVLALLVTFFSSALVGLVLLAARRLDLGARMPFGPHLALGTVAALVGGEPAVARLGDVLLG